MNRTAEYVKAVKQMVEMEGLEAANLANHKALETGLITLDEFRAAAKALVALYLK